MTDVDQPNEDANDRDDFRQHVTEIVEFALQGRFLAYLLADGGVDVANCSPLSGENDYRTCGAVYYSCALSKS